MVSSTSSRRMTPSLTRLRAATKMATMRPSHTAVPTRRVLAAMRWQSFWGPTKKAVAVIARRFPAMYNCAKARMFSSVYLRGAAGPVRGRAGSGSRDRGKRRSRKEAVAGSCGAESGRDAKLLLAQLDPS